MADLVVHRGLDLDFGGSRTATWVGRVRTPTASRSQIARDLPLIEVPREHRAEYVAHRCAIAEPVSSDPAIAVATREIYLQSDYRAAAIQILQDRGDKVLDVVTAGRDLAFRIAIPAPNGAIAAIEMQFVPGRWPFGALQLQGTAFDAAVAWMHATAQRTGAFCVGVVVLTWFLEDGVPRAKHGLDVHLVVSTIPKIDAAHPVPPFPMIVHRELLAERELRELERLQRQLVGRPI